MDEIKTYFYIMSKKWKDYSVTIFVKILWWGNSQKPQPRIETHRNLVPVPDMLHLKALDWGYINLVLSNSYKPLNGEKIGSRIQNNSWKK